MQIFFSVGAATGPIHAAQLIDTLRRAGFTGEFRGLGGPRMAAAGCRLQADMTSSAVMWFWHALLQVPRFVRLLRQADRCFRDERPDAVVLIDFPGFNWWVARCAKRRGIPVVYYGTPQLWAWASHRVRKMRRLVDHVLCKLPFEPAWFAARGCRATYVGHPYFDELRHRKLDASFVASLRGDGPLITILPGSRDQEVASHAAAFLRAAMRIRERFPAARFAVAAYKPSHAEAVARLAAALGAPATVHVQRTAELIEASTCCLACSGSVSLELLHHAKPSVVLYQVSRLAFRVQRRFRRVRYITLVNLLSSARPFTESPAGHYDRHDPRDADALFPEYLTCEDKSSLLAEHVCEWLSDAEARERLVARLVALRERTGQGGASERAAAYLIDVLHAAATTPTSEGMPLAA